MAIGEDPEGGEPAVSMEDAVHALMDLLVDPLLPSRVSLHATPAVSNQISVGKQMHSVVILCNYYHRKQFSELKFLDYENFCKVALHAKPSLRMHMKSIMEMEAGDFNNQPSITEKMIRDACNISSTLDSSKNDPDIDGWPISQVAVFLVDRKRVKCYLEFSSITKGVWSLLEHELNNPIENVMGADKQRYRKKRDSISDGVLEKEDLLQQLAFSALKQKTGLDPSKFQILDHYIAYSLILEKTVTRLYIMKTTESVNGVLEEFSINEVLNSLRGPVVRNGKNPEVTSVVEYYHMLPYVNALNDWFTRESIPAASTNLLPTHLEVAKECSFDSNPMPAHQDHGNHKSSDQTKGATPTISEIAGVKTDGTGEDSSHEAFGRQSNSNISSLDLDMLPSVKSQAISWQSVQNEIESNKACREVSTPLVKKPLVKRENEENKKKHNLSSGEDFAQAACEAASSQIVPDRLPTKENQLMKCQSTVDEDETSRESAGLTSRATKKLRTTKDNREFMGLIADEATNKENNLFSIEDSAKEAFRSEAHADNSEMVDAGIAAGYQAVRFSSKMTENNSNIPPFEIITSLPKKSNTMEIKYGEHFGVGDANQTIQDAVGPSDISLLAIKSQSVQYDYDLAIASKRDDLLRALLAVLQKRREELSHQQCYFEDQIARCEMNIQAILSDLEGSGKLSVESVLEAINESHSSQMSTKTCDVARSQPKDIKIRRLSEAVLAMKDPCQELEDICSLNCWTSPRYNVLPSYDSGNYQAILTVKGVDFQCSVHGDFKCNPTETRSSAASKMLRTLSSMAGQGQNK